VPSSSRRRPRRSSVPALLQDRPNRARRLGDVGKQLGERVAYVSGAPPRFSAGTLSISAAMQNTLRLASERVELRARCGHGVRVEGVALASLTNTIMQPRC
jgi:hypothetical protein